MKEEWYIDNACSRHDGKHQDIIQTKEKGLESFRFGDNKKRRIIGKGMVGTNLKIKDVSQVHELKFNR